MCFQSPLQEPCHLREDYSFHLFQKLLIFIKVDELLETQMKKKYTRREEKDGCGEISHPFNTFLKEID